MCVYILVNCMDRAEVPKSTLKVCFSKRKVNCTHLHKALDYYAIRKSLKGVYMFTYIGTYVFTILPVCILTRSLQCNCIRRDQSTTRFDILRILNPHT